MTNETHKTLLSVHERLFGDRSEFPTKDMGWAFWYFNATIGRATVTVEALYEAKQTADDGYEQSGGKRVMLIGNPGKF